MNYTSRGGVANAGLASEYEKMEEQLIKTSNDKESWLLGSKHPVDIVSKWQETINLMVELFKAPAGFIVQKNSEGYQIVVASETRENPYPVDGSVIGNDINLFCRKVVNENKPLYVNHATRDDEWLDNPEVHNDGFNSYLGLPVHWPDGTVFGTICVMDFAVTHYQKIFKRLIDRFRSLVEADLKILDQYLVIQELSMRDHLTGLFNRSGFFTLGEQALEMAQRMGKRYTVLFIDLDDLKLINDQFGHSAGDDALKTLANILQDRLRQADVIARIGGDEYAVLMVMDSMLNLKHVIQQIQYSIKKVGDLREYPFSASIGHSGICSHSEAFLEEALRDADRDMYLCKGKHHSQ
ncbi:diguanylate cyclase [Alkalimarinus coralli]|uniref:sensor domain-containing diguanylate cyclase n=1 Tax=Alkalimarinus coralli TaxID=2935863 RepID=UPI00202B8364|nr:diguanylate cyclase [Alkalimarinus coralli]